jgi:tripartite-type tricarboxylate transporter receptor subunit TctC
MTTLRFSVVLAALLLTPGISVAQGTSDGPFPSRTVTIVVPTGPSGQTDVFARLIAEQLRTRLGQPFVVENKPGAGGSVAGRYLASRPADGYTLMYGSMSTIIIAPHLQKPLAYDSTKAFAPIALTQSGSSPLTVRASLPFQSARDLVEYARKNPGTINFASQGVGSVGHLAMELLSSKTDIKMTHVPFSGTGAGIAAMLGGQVDVIIADILTSRPHVQSGTLRYISQLASQRSPAIPDVPTMAEELNVPELAMDFWLGLFAPTGTPQPIIRQLNEEVAAVMQVPSVRQRLEATTMTTPAISPTDFSRLVAQQFETWGKVIRDAGIAN